MCVCGWGDDGGVSGDRENTKGGEGTAWDGYCECKDTDVDTGRI